MRSIKAVSAANLQTDLFGRTGVLYPWDFKD